MATRSFIDMMGRRVDVSYPPQRIISLVPSQTELLYDLELEEQVIGITKFCVHPESWFRSKTRIGGTKQVHIDRVRELKPDLIIANKEENLQEQVEALAAEFPVWVSDIKNIDEALEMICGIGSLTGKKAKASNIVGDVTLGFANLQKAAQSKRVAYFIWRGPWMCAGADTFISNMIKTIGWQNVVEKERYPEMTLPELKELKPEFVLLSSEPYPFKEKHITEIQEAVPDAKVMLVDGEMFSWYGSRMREAIPYFSSLLGS